MLARTILIGLTNGACEHAPYVCYMSNAAGRLLGTLLSGVNYQLGGLPACLATTTAMAAASWLCAGLLAKKVEA